MSPLNLCCFLSTSPLFGPLGTQKKCRRGALEASKLAVFGPRMHILDRRHLYQTFLTPKKWQNHWNLMGARLNINQCNPTDKIDARVLAKSNIAQPPGDYCCWAHCGDERAVHQVKKLTSAPARNSGEDEGYNWRKTITRLSILLVKWNAALLSGRIPTSPSAFHKAGALWLHTNLIVPDVIVFLLWPICTDSTFDYVC